MTAELLDHGFHHISFGLSVRFRVSSGSDHLALGIRGRMSIRITRSSDYCIIWRGDVRYIFISRNHLHLIGLYRIYDRTVRPTIPEPTTTGLRYRVETLIGITGWKMARYRPSWGQSSMAILHVVWRPHLLSVLVFEVSTPI